MSENARKSGRIIRQRPREKYCGLLREFPGGKIEPGETAEACIVRECREELGVTLKVHGERGVWVRPASMWNETVERDGKTYRRFTFIGEQETRG